VEQVAEQVALALESARLFAQTQNTLGETEDLYRGSAELSVASNYEEVLEANPQKPWIRLRKRTPSIGLFDHPWTDASPAESLMSGDMVFAASRGSGTFPAALQCHESPMTMA